MLSVLPGDLFLFQDLKPAKAFEPEWWQAPRGIRIGHLSTGTQRHSQILKSGPCLALNGIDVNKAAFACA